MSRGQPGGARGAGAAAGDAHHSDRAQKTPPLQSLVSEKKEEKDVRILFEGSSGG